jgi:predicted alpha/beta superfamily hydrolase
MKKIAIALIYLQVFIIQIYGQSYTEEHVFYSSNLKEERTISVSLPIDYNENNKKYPVLYVLDGEYIFDYAKGTVNFLTNDFGYLPEMILVGIPNTDRDRDLFVSLNPEDGYLNFVNFLKNEVFSIISDKYRINEFNILFGWSSGSGICSYLLATEPDLIRAYILTGSGLGKRFESFMKEKITKSYFQDNVFLYVNTEAGPREPLLRKFESLIDSLMPNNMKYKFEIVDQSHVESMQVGLADGLKFILSDFIIPTEKSKKGFKEILDYYSELKTKYNFEFSIPAGAINESSGILYFNDKKDDAIELLKYGIDLYPNSTTLYGSLAEIYKSELDFKLAAEYYQRALELSSKNIQNYLKYKTLINEIGQ